MLLAVALEFAGEFEEGGVPLSLACVWLLIVKAKVRYNFKFTFLHCISEVHYFSNVRIFYKIAREDRLFPDGCMVHVHKGVSSKPKMCFELWP